MSDKKTIKSKISQSRVSKVSSKRVSKMQSTHSKLLEKSLSPSPSPKPDGFERDKRSEISTKRISLNNELAF